MDSIKNFATARLCLVLLIIFNFIGAYALENDSDKIYITDFKYFRQIQYKNQQLLLYKSSAIKSIFYLSNSSEQSFTKKNGQIQADFQTSIKNAHYKINYSNNKIKLASKVKTIYFKEADQSVCEKTLEDKYTKIDSRQFRNALNAEIISAHTDSSCNEDQKQKVGEVLANMFLSEKSWLKQCYGNKSVNKLIESDPNYLSYSLSVYSRYLNLIEKLKANDKSLQFSCKISTPDKLGSFDETANPLKISFDWNNLSKQTGPDNQLAESIKTTLGHELFHYGEQMQTPEDQATSSCINEAYAKLFTDVCAATEDEKNLETNKNTDLSEKIKNQKIATSEEIVAACKQNKTFVSQVITSNQSIYDVYDAKLNHTGTSSIFADQQLQQEQLNKKIDAQLNTGTNPVKPSDFTAVDDSKFATLASNTVPNTQLGKPYTVSANSDYGKVVQNTMSTFANNTLKQKISHATQMVINTAQAATQTLTGTTKLNTGSSNNTLDGSTATATTTTATTSTTNSKTIPSDESNQNSRMPAATDGESSDAFTVSGKQVSNSSGRLASELAGGTSNGSGTNSTTVKGSNAKAIGPAGTGLEDASKGTSTPAPTKTGDKAKIDNSEALAQSLKAFNIVNGGQYQVIRSYYNDGKFRDSLKAGKIRIMIKNRDGKYVGIGVDSDKAEKIFTDNGQILQTVKKEK